MKNRRLVLACLCILMLGTAAFAKHHVWQTGQLTNTFYDGDRGVVSVPVAGTVMTVPVIGWTHYVVESNGVVYEFETRNAFRTRIGATIWFEIKNKKSANIRMQDDKTLSVDIVAIESR